MTEINEENLRRFYIEEDHTVGETAEFFGKSKTTMSRILKKYKIGKYAKRTDVREDKITKEFLLEKYFKDDFSIYQIAEICGVNHWAIRTLFKKFGIKVKSQKLVLSDYISDEQLMSEYLSGKGTGQIAIEYGLLSIIHLIRRLKELGVTIRGPKFMTEARKRRDIFQKKDGQGDISSQYWNKIKQGAVKRGLEFNITGEYIWNLFLYQGKKCAITGVDLTLSSGGSKDRRRYQTASLDRIDSSRGYTEENVQWVHKYINRMKGASHDSELYEWAKLIYENLKDKYGK